jgi:hypothetical protein
VIILIQKIFLDMLNSDSVSVATKKFVEVEGVEYQIGGDHRCAYENSESGRRRLQNEVAEPYLSAILDVWGTEPTVVISAPENKGESGVKCSE